MDLTDVLHLLNVGLQEWIQVQRISVIKESAELIIKAASVEKNIRIFFEYLQYQNIHVLL